MKRTWDFTITLQMSDKAMHKLWDLSDAAQEAGDTLPEWRMGKRVAWWLQRQGIEAKLVRWQWGNPQPPKMPSRPET